MVNSRKERPHSISADSSRKDLARWVWGKQAVLELLKVHPHKVQEVLISVAEENRQKREIVDLCARNEIPVSIKEGKEIDRILPVPAHQNVAAW